MHLLFISEEGKSLGLAMRVVKEEFQVSYFVEQPQFKQVGVGLVPIQQFNKPLINNNGECIVSNTKELIESAGNLDLVVVDGLKLGKVTDFLKERNTPVMGVNHWASVLCRSSDYAHKILNNVGIQTEISTSTPFIFVKVGCWWNGLSIRDPFICYNEDRVMTGNLGQPVESVGMVIKSIVGTKLLKDTFGKLERLLKKSSFRGWLTLECIIDKNNLFGLDFSTSALYLPSFLELYKGSITEMLLALAIGQEPKGSLTEDYSLSLLLSVPPFPIRDCPLDFTEVNGINSDNLKHIYLMDAQVQNKVMRTALAGGDIMWVNARGRDVGECQRRVGKTLQHINVENMQYRLDVGDRVRELEYLLKKWNYV
jgi:phosphoribosylamine-glycine ligase